MMLLGKPPGMNASPIMEVFICGIRTPAPLQLNSTSAPYFSVNAVPIFCIGSLVHICIDQKLLTGVVFGCGSSGPLIRRVDTAGNGDGCKYCRNDSNILKNYVASAGCTTRLPHPQQPFHPTSREESMCALISAFI